MTAASTNQAQSGSDVPDHVPADLVHWLDFYKDDVVLADPVGFMLPLRERFRAFFSPAFGGFWALTRYADQRDAFQRHDLFSSNVDWDAGVGFQGEPLLPLMLDPPEHVKYRALINPAFSPKRIRELEEKARRIANELIDDILAAGAETDFNSSYAEKLPTRIFVDMMGLPYDHYVDFLNWNKVLVHTLPTDEGVQLRYQAAQDITEYLTELIDVRYKDPGDDLVSVLISSEVDGHKLTAGEVLRVIFLLFVAGLDTVTAAHNWVWKWLAEHPVARKSLLDRPDLVPGAVEELLRINSFVNPVRMVRQDVEFAGVQMKKGERVWLHSGVACRDPREFKDPDVVDFTRAPNRHLAFAAGPHRCVGSHLARLELKVSLEEWHKRIPDYQIPPGARVGMHGGGIAGPDNLPLHMG
jgi:cytochrome P450